MLKKTIRKKLEKLIAHRGYRLVPDNTYNWPLKDTEFLEIFSKQRDFGGWTPDGSKIHRMYMVKNFITTLGKKENAHWAECGVYKGSTSLLLAEYAKRYQLLASNCKIHLFDSFAGISDPDLHDQGTNMVKGDYAASEHQVKSNLADYPFFEFHRGWIPQRFPQVSDLSFSFVHIDVDLYQPVLDSLDFFIPRMCKGGIIVLDDYGYQYTPGAYKATNEIAQKYQRLVGHLPFGQAFLMMD